MSRGFGRIERMILGALSQRRQPLLADRWHPLWVYPLSADDPLTGRQINEALRGAIDERLPYYFFGGQLPESEWKAVIDVAKRSVDELHAGPHLGDPLAEVIELKYHADNPYALEVSVQRAAKRLEQKSLIERCYVTRVCASWRKRSIVCVRIKPAREEASEAVELRNQAKQTHWHHTLEAVRWVRKRGQDIETRGEGRGEVIGYLRAIIDWREQETTRDDWKWLSWFDTL